MSDEQKQENQETSSETSAEPEKGVFDPDKATKEQWLALVAQKDEEMQQLQDRVMRIAAESENTRKRLERDREEKICFANESLIQAMLPVLDNLERAVQHAETNTNTESLLEGVRMTLKGFTDALDRFGCTSFESVGKAFDPNYHEAMLQEQSAEHPDNTVLQELEKGYLLKERLLRPAKVVVSKAPPGSNSEEPGEGTSQSENSSEKEAVSPKSSVNNK
jgi:molecular chaperone GrpE